MVQYSDCSREFQENYHYAHDFWNPYHTNAQVYSYAASGEAWSYKEKKALIDEGREPLNLNIMRRPLQFFSGYLRDNLPSVVVTPVEGSDEATADDLTEVMYYIWDKGKGFPIFLDNADEVFKAGLGLVGIRMDYSRDFINGDITFFRRTYNSFLLDPTFESISLDDCGFAIMRDLLSKEAVKQLLPEKIVDPKVIDDVQGTYRDDKFLSYYPQFTNQSRNRYLLSYDQYYVKKTRTRKFLVDRENSFYRDITDLPEDEMKRLKRGLNRLTKLYESAPEEGIDRRDLPPMLEIQDVERPYVVLNVLLNGQHVFEGEDETGIVESYPFVAPYCYFEPSIWEPQFRITGIAGTLYSAQREFNKRHMKIVDMMDSTIATGYKYLIGSISDPNDLKQTGQNRVIGVDPENAPQGLDSVQELQGGTASPALIEYQQILDNLTLTLANVNESVLGIDDKGNTQISGRLAQVRVAQGLRSNRKVFDNIETAQQALGSICLKAIQLKYPTGKIKRILGREPSPQFYEREFEQYDAVIQQGVRSQSQRDAYYYELVNLKREGIVDVSQKDIIEALNMTGMSKLKKSIAEQEQAQQEQAQQTQQLQDKYIEADINEKNALANERNTRSDANEGLTYERASEAMQNRAKAVLDRAKTITEIAKMEDERLIRVIQFVQGLEAAEIADREQAAAAIESRADEEDTERKSAEDEITQIMTSMRDQPIG